MKTCLLHGNQLRVARYAGKSFYLYDISLSDAWILVGRHSSSSEATWCPGSWAETSMSSYCLGLWGLQEDPKMGHTR